MPVPSEPAPADQQQRDGHTWSGKPLADWLSVLVALFALVVSLLSFFQSRGAEKAANEAKERESAIKVGFWRQDYSNPQVLHVINRNAFDLNNVTVRFNDGYFIKVGLVPSCQAWTLAGFTVPGAQTNSTYTLKFPARLDFQDQQSPAVAWTIADEPPHRQKSPPSLPRTKDLTDTFRQHMIGPYFAGCAA
ncbi:hypothetical protein [Streptomyces massasporeus]|uniref:hypothetical protein n=1 Tax=Streptomyces massasporeus TaxID=67324 RepID=UPI003657FA0B